MPLREFIASLRPPGTYDAWVAALAARGWPISRAALEHYVSGRRRPESEVFARLLVVAGRAEDDREGWRVWGAAIGIPDGVIGTDQAAP